MSRPWRPFLFISQALLWACPVDARRSLVSTQSQLNISEVEVDSASSRRRRSCTMQQNGKCGIWSYYELPGPVCSLNNNFMGSCAKGGTSFEKDWECMDCNPELRTSLALEYQGRFWGEHPEDCPSYKGQLTRPSWDLDSADACFGSSSFEKISKKWFKAVEEQRHEQLTDYNWNRGRCQTALGEGGTFQTFGSGGSNLKAHCMKACDLDWGRCLAYESDYNNNYCYLHFLHRKDLTYEGTFYTNLIWDPVERGNGAQSKECYIRDRSLQPPWWMLSMGFFDNMDAYLVEDWRSPVNGKCRTLLHNNGMVILSKSNKHNKNQCRDRCDDKWEECVGFAFGDNGCKLYEYSFIEVDETLGDSSMWDPLVAGDGTNGWKCVLKVLPWSPPGLAYDWGIADLLTFE